MIVIAIVVIMALTYPELIEGGVPVMALPEFIRLKCCSAQALEALILPFASTGMAAV